MSDTYPKYQVSRMDGEYQVVYRTDEVEEFADMLAGIKKLEIKPVAPVTKGYASTGNVPITADDFNDKHQCPVHDVEMVSKMSKKTGKPYFSHFTENKEICFGKGALPSKF